MKIKVYYATLYVGMIKMYFKICLHLQKYSQPSQIVYSCTYVDTAYNNMSVFVLFFSKCES